MSNNYMFKSTYERFLKRLQEIQAERVNLIQELEVAAGFGDLRENAEFDSAMERQGQLNREAESILKRITNIQFIDSIKICPERVSIGSIVKVEDIGNQGLQRYYCIVGCIEDDCPEGYIKATYNSPAAKKLLGRGVGDIVMSIGPNSAIVKILEIKHMNINAIAFDTK